MAEWIANTAEENVSSAFQVLRELPARPTERTSKLHTELEDAARREPQPLHAVPCCCSLYCAWHPAACQALLDHGALLPVLVTDHRARPECFRWG
jgi:hypothetical protein